MMSKKFGGVKIVIALLICLAVAIPTAGAVIIEPDTDLHGVMGDLYALSIVMRLYYDDVRKTQNPTLDELVHYLRSPLPGGWPADYRTAMIRGGWWVGRRVPEFSTARRFLRANALSLGLYEEDGQSAWLGGSFVWVNAVSFDESSGPGQAVFRVAQEEDGQHLFFNSPGTDYYWRSGLLYADRVHARVLQELGTDAKGPFVMPPPLIRASETLSASPVELPPDFTVGGDDEESMDARIGDVIFNPIPRQRDD